MIYGLQDGMNLNIYNMMDMTILDADLYDIMDKDKRTKQYE